MEFHSQINKIEPSILYKLLSTLLILFFSQMTLLLWNTTISPQIFLLLGVVYNVWWVFLSINNQEKRAHFGPHCGTILPMIHSLKERQTIFGRYRMFLSPTSPSLAKTAFGRLSVLCGWYYHQFWCALMFPCWGFAWQHWPSLKIKESETRHWF